MACYCLWQWKNEKAELRLDMAWSPELLMPFQEEFWPITLNQPLRNRDIMKVLILQAPNSLRLPQENLKASQKKNIKRKKASVWALSFY